MKPPRTMRPDFHDAPDPDKPDSMAAAVWVLREQGSTYTDIRRQLGCTIDFIAQTLASDRARHESIIALMREERATLWLAREREALRMLSHLTAALYESMIDPKTGKPRPGSKRRLEQMGIRLGHLLAQTASAAARVGDLLLGNPTDRIALEGGSDLSAPLLTEDVIIERAIAFAAIDLLPPLLQDRARRRMEERAPHGPSAAP